MPRLHTLGVHTETQLTEVDQKFNRSQIRTLILHDASGSAGDHIRSYPNVFALTCLENRGSSFRGAAVPLSRRSKDLTVRCLHDRQPADILRRFNAPWSLLFGHSISDHGHRSQCTLTKLVLKDCRTRIPELLRILELTPHLESFTVIHHGPTISVPHSKNDMHRPF